MASDVRNVTKPHEIDILISYVYVIDVSIMKYRLSTMYRDLSTFTIYELKQSLNITLINIMYKMKTLTNWSWKGSSHSHDHNDSRIVQIGVRMLQISSEY